MIAGRRKDHHFRQRNIENRGVNEKRTRVLPAGPNIFSIIVTEARRDNERIQTNENTTTALTEICWIDKERESRFLCSSYCAR